MGLTMAANVWMVIWPNQQIVIANARNVQAGGEANPDAPAAGRRGCDGLPAEHDLLAAVARLHGRARRTSTTSCHWDQTPGGAKWGLYFIVGIAIIAVLELNALGKISGTGSGGLNVIYETHKNAMYTGFALIVFFYVFAEIVLRR